MKKMGIKNFFLYRKPSRRSPWGNFQPPTITPWGDSQISVLARDTMMLLLYLLRWMLVVKGWFVQKILHRLDVVHTQGCAVDVLGQAFLHRLCPKFIFSEKNSKIFMGER
jgi:hypothetical protein